MANQFTNNQKVKLIAGEVYDNVPYLKKAHSYMTQGELDGKKYGRTYKVYIPDPGKAVDGIVADPDTINEVAVDVTLDNINTSVELDVWNKLTDIESFTKEIVKPRARMLARSLEKKAIDNTVFKAHQVAVGTQSFATLAEAAGKLDEVGVAGNKVSFIKPTVAAKIAAGGLANFIPDAIQTKIYKDKYLGQYAGAAQIEESLLPTIKTGSAVSGTFSLGDATTASVGGATVTASYGPITAMTGFAGTPYKINGLKIVDKNGIFTDQDFYVIPDADGKIPEVRVAVSNNADVDAKTDRKNANAWVASGDIASVSATPVLSADTEYFVGQVRTEEAVGFDSYKFSDLPGSENATESVDGVSIKMSEYGDGKNMVTLARLDVPHAVCLPDARESVAIYFTK